jgi:hypothetical protein
MLSINILSVNMPGVIMLSIIMQSIVTSYDMVTWKKEFVKDNEDKIIVMFCNNIQHNDIKHNDTKHNKT